MGCINSTQETNHPNSIEKIHISNSVEKIQFSSIISSIQCIPLQEPEQALLADSWKVRIHKNLIYQYSLTSLSINIFDNEGKHVSTIDSRSQGRVTYPVDFIINEQHGELWVLDDKRTIKRYNLSGKDYKGAINLPTPAVSLTQIQNGEILVYDGNFNRNGNKYITLLDVNSTKNVSYGPQKTNKRINQNIPATLFTSNSKGTTYTLMPLNDTIYITKPNENKYFEPHYHLDFNGKYLTETIWPDKGFTDKEYHKLIISGNIAYNINSFYYAAQRLFFSPKGLNNAYYAIETNNNKLVCFTSLFDGIKPSTPATSIQGSTDSALLFIFSASELLNHYRNRNFETEHYEIKSLLQNVDNTNQQILIICNLK